MFITRMRIQNYGFLEITNIYNEIRKKNIDFFMLNGYVNNHNRTVVFVGYDNNHRSTMALNLTFEELGVGDFEMITNFNADYNSEILRLTIESTIQEAD